MTDKKELEVQAGKYHQFSLISGENDMVILEEKDQNMKILHENKRFDVVVKASDPDHKKFVINVEGYDFTVSIQEPIDKLIRSMGFLKPASHSVRELKAPMPGLVLDIFARVGDEVEEGQNLLSLEAMKMENILKSPGSGIIEEIKVEKGAAVEKNQTLIVFAK